MVKIFGIEIGSAKKHQEEITKLQTQIMEEQFNNNFRPVIDQTQVMGDEIVKIPYYPLPERHLFDVAAHSDVLRNVIRALNKEIFRHGFEITEKFAKKCKVCGKEFEHPVDECDECKKEGRPFHNLRDPNSKQREILEVFLKRVNDNEQDIIKVCKMVNNDIETIDNGYFLLVKDYFWNEEGMLIGSLPRELVRADPKHIRIIADDTGRLGRNKAGEIIRTCLEHREEFWVKRLKCPRCGRKLFPAYYRGQAPNGKYLFYIKNEIYHTSKYMPSMVYGFSPIFSVWMKVNTLMYQDRYMLDYYLKQRPPRALMFVNTSNMNSLQKMWAWMKDQFKKNPHQIPPCGVETPGKGKFIEYIDFMKSLDEMQFIEARNEFRRSIGCYDEKTEIFTSEGWKLFSELTEKELVAEVNDNLTINFVKPRHYFKADYEGEMYSFKTKSLDLLVTPNHNMVVVNENKYYSTKQMQMQLKRADQTRRCIIPQTIEWEGKEIDKFTVAGQKLKNHILKPIVLNGDDYCKFMGIYLSEGSVSKDKYYKVQIAQSKDNNKEKYEKIKEMIKSLPFNYFEVKNKGIVVNSKQLNEYLRQFGYSGEKYVPDEIKNATKRQVRIFLDWFILGDGYKRTYIKNGHTNERIITKSKKLADDIQELYLKLEISTTLRKTKEGYYEVSTRHTKNNKWKKYSRIRKENIEKEYYKGKIYCVEVSSHKLLVRRNGKIAVCGNSVYGVMPLFQADVSTSGGLNNEGLQVTVTNRAVEDGQEVYNKGFFPWLLKQLRITDYVLELVPSEERDEMAELQIEAQKIQNARMMQSMGFDVTLNEDGDFEYEPTEVPVEPPTPTEGMREGVPRIGTTGQVEPPQNMSGEPPDMRRSKDAPISTTTTEVTNPRYNMRRRELEKFLQKTLEDIIKETKTKMSIKKQGEGMGDMIKFLMGSLFTGKFKGISTEKSNLIKEYLIRALTKKYPLTRIINYINRKGGKNITPEQAETIARTEIQALQNKAREWSYKKVDPQEKFKYKWINPLDNRTTEICKKLVARTRNGVSLDTLKKMIAEESKLAGFEPREFTPHIGCRSTFVKI